MSVNDRQGNRSPHLPAFEDFSAIAGVPPDPPLYPSGAPDQRADGLETERESGKQGSQPV
jgi:hypothetical protein